jgi:tRNA threonylcarbamoyladenosine biosynthesis protein TsaB
VPQVRVLAIDTSSSVGSVALVLGGATPWDAQVVAEATARVSNAHGESLLPLVDAVLKSARTTLSEIDLLAVGIGPGSFTGTRVGVATAKGLALGASRPLRGVNAFEALAVDVGAPAGAEVAVAIDARKGEVYLALVSMSAGDVTVVGEPAHTPPSLAFARFGRSPEQLQFVAGDGVAMVSELARPRRRIGPDAPRAAAVAAVAAARQLRAPMDEADSLEPLYVRPPDITLPKSR